MEASEAVNLYRATAFLLNLFLVSITMVIWPYFLFSGLKRSLKDIWVVGRPLFFLVYLPTHILALYQCENALWFILGATSCIVVYALRIHKALKFQPQVQK